MIIQPHEKYIPSLVKQFGLEGRKEKATPDWTKESLEGEELPPERKHLFRSGMGTLLYLSHDRPDVQHAVRNLAQCMSRPTVPAEECIRHTILYLKGTPEYGVLLPYNGNSKLCEIYGKECEGSQQRIEIFTDADWAGDRSSPMWRRHSVSSCLVYLNGGLLLSWSRSQKSIALSSCESEYLSAVFGGAEGIFVKRAWNFLTRKEVEMVIATDSSSCRAFCQRQGVGKLKHVDTRYL